MAVTISLVEMSPNQTGKVVAFQSGLGMARHLESMGIRIGTKITKVSQQLMSGPVIISHGNTQVALGFGMAQKIMVEIEE